MISSQSSFFEEIEVIDRFEAVEYRHFLQLLQIVVSLLQNLSVALVRVLSVILVGLVSISRERVDCRMQVLS